MYEAPKNLKGDNFYILCAEILVILGHKKKKSFVNSSQIIFHFLKILRWIHFQKWLYISHKVSFLFHNFFF